jgi:hypothetical protein
MAKVKTKPVVIGDAVATPTGITRTWATSNATYISGRAYIDGADKAAADMETKWGCGRLRLLVGPELREKFDRQRYLLNRAIWHGELEDVRRESQRMVNAWMALDAAAEAAGAPKLDPTILEVVLDSGVVAAIVPDLHAAQFVKREDRRMDVYTLDEIGRLLSAFPGIAKIKESYPGAEVVRCKRSIDDPMDAIHDTDQDLEEVF